MRSTADNLNGRPARWSRPLRVTTGHALHRTPLSSARAHLPAHCRGYHLGTHHATIDPRGATFSSWHCAPYDQPTCGKEASGKPPKRIGLDSEVVSEDSRGSCFCTRPRSRSIRCRRPVSYAQDFASTMLPPVTWWHTSDTSHDVSITLSDSRMGSSGCLAECRRWGWSPDHRVREPVDSPVQVRRTNGRPDLTRRNVP